MQKTPDSAGGAMAYLQLFRLPNVFTAAADVLMGYLVTHDRVEQPGVLAVLVAASCLLYTAGMVLNDVFDVEVDARERPHRPLPSGRIAVGTARGLGLVLLLLGASLGWGAAYLTGNARPGMAASALAIAVWMYDSMLKRTPLAPLAMGSCRFLNVLLGMSLAVGPWSAWHYAIAGAIGVYITGVTWFARTEARESSRAQLAGAVAVILGGIAALVFAPQAIAPDPWPVAVAVRDWYLLWLLLGMSIAWRLLRAVANPTPEAVQPAVKVCIFSLIVLDAVVVYGRHGYEGIAWVLVILFLLAPTMFLGKWIYST